jgi:hypothetical protein
MITIAVLLGLWVTVSSLLATLLFAVVYCLLPTPLVICAIFARGDAQAVAIGVLIPWWTRSSWLPNSSYIFMAIWLLTMCAACGVIAAITRRWIVASSI